MTICATRYGFHEFPYEDETGAYCEEHGVMLLRKRPPATGSDLGATWRPPCEPCLFADLFNGPHRCEGIAAWHVEDPEPGASGPRPCGCRCRDAGPA